MIERELVKIVLGSSGDMQYEVPGTVPYWLAANPARRRKLAKKLRDLASSCWKKEWPFEEKT